MIKVRLRTTAILLVSESILIMAGVLGLMRDDIYPGTGALMGAAVITIPYLIERSGWMRIPTSIQLWIVLAIGLHTLGLMWGLYDDTWWWDHMTHAVSATLVGLLAAMALYIIEMNSESIYLPGWAYPFLILIFSVFTGALWETGEFAGDAFFGTRMQYSVIDTMNDLYFDMFGGAVGGLLWHFRSSREASELEDVVNYAIIARLKRRFAEAP